MPVVQHLAELRRRIVISILAIAVASIAGVVFYDDILDRLLAPYCDIQPAGRRCDLLVTDPLEGFVTRLRVAAYTGIFVALPVVLWQLWRFVTPGLRPTEKRYAIPFVSASVVLFGAGAALSAITFPRALEFLQEVGGENLFTQYSPGPYLRLVLFMMLAFGIAFEFPVLLVALQLSTVVSNATLRRYRRHAVVAIVAAAAVITPSQDPYSLLALSVPLYLFYELAVLIGRLAKR